MIAPIALPRLLRIGGGASREIGAVLRTLGLARPLIVTDRFLASHSQLDALLGALANAGIARAAVRVFADTVPDPTVASVEAGVAFARAGEHDCVVGFGGGSPLDSAKAIATLLVHGGRMRDYKAPHNQDAPGLPIIAIPTTAGTGSEATRFTIITDEATDEKMLCIGLAYLPVAALVDFEWTLTKPKRLTADTGVDSLTHAIEAYVSRRANPFSDALALAAMRAIWQHLPTAYFEPANRAAREAMMLAATQAGMAFSNSSVALVHGMSRPIGAFFHVPHGLSNAMLLPAVTAFSVEAARGRYADCARAMGLVSADEKTDDRRAADALLAGLRELNRRLEVPAPRAYGIDPARWESVVPTMAQQALASGSPANNPRVPSAAEIEALYAEVWKG
ncbi:MAG: iron-containing alcohol dehydrogenase [Verrucomicrobia bacterium]|nr:iron-containing alcohol dehydrogenase [Verrucomicrobiota bacterium]